MKNFINKYIEMIRDGKGELNQYEFNFLSELNVGSHLMAYVSLDNINNKNTCFVIEDTYFLQVNLVDDLAFLCAMSTNTLELLDIGIDIIAKYFDGLPKNYIEECVLDNMNTFIPEEN